MKISNELIDINNEFKEICENSIKGTSNNSVIRGTLYLPDKKVLQEKLKEWVNEIENNNESCVVKPNFLC